MLRITITLVPHGNESRAKVLHTGEIWNDGSGTRGSGNYGYRFSQRNRTNVVWREGKLKGFERLRKGCWQILLACLSDCAVRQKFSNEEIPTEEEVPDEKDGLRCEEKVALEAIEAEADLQEKVRMAIGIPGAEIGAWAVAEMLRMRKLCDDRTERELAPSKGEKDAGGITHDYSRVRDPMPPEDPCGAQLGDGDGLPDAGIPEGWPVDQLVYCKCCHKTHGVKKGEIECHEGAWIPSD